MIKEQSFEWLLEGCHRIADVAVAYYPNYAYACSAVKALRRSIAEHACLLKDLTDQGYTARTAHLTPVQIGILLSYWGMPDHVMPLLVFDLYYDIIQYHYTPRERHLSTAHGHFFNSIK